MDKVSDENRTILIIGDWVVDEYWFLVRHYSDISSHTGFIHYRVDSNPGDIVFDLCGAGRVARVLYHLQKRGKDTYNLVGLGNWNENDADILKHLIHARLKKYSCRVAIAAFELKYSFCLNPPEINLISLNPRGPTIRVIRQYQNFEGKVEQISRVDWEPQKSEHDIKNQRLFEREQLITHLPKEVSSIVIHDLKKGVVTDHLIKILSNSYPGANWFVRSKDRKPDWLSRIEDKLELLVVGPEVAAQHNPWSSWLLNDKVSFQALEVIKNLPGRNVVLLSNKREIIAKVKIHDETKCVSGRSLVESTPLNQLNWPSAFFASLIYTMFGKQAVFTEKNIKKALHWADDEKFSGIPTPELAELKPKENRRADVQSGSWNLKIEEWAQAREGCGIITKDSELFLEIWRGHAQLPGYIACIEEKQKIINRIGQKLRTFKRGEQKRSLAIMLNADPGAGKTALAKLLADAFDFAYIRYDVTQMFHRDDLIELFDEVATMQANQSKPILVFIDEINAFIDRSHVYGAFLAPIEEGVYRRRGKSFSLKPCIWIFAGTKMHEEHPTAPEKYSDFKSRINLTVDIDYISLKDKSIRDTHEFDCEARLEQVYLGAMLITKFFPGVKEISLEVLEQFRIQDPAETPARKIRDWATSLRNVQYGKVTKDNCEACEGMSLIKDKKSEKFVKLVF